MLAGDGEAKSFNNGLAFNNKKLKPIRTESWSIRRIFKENDFGYINDIAKKKRTTDKGCKGFMASALFSALLFMYLKGWTSTLELVRFLKQHREWLIFLNLKRNVKGEMKYVAPDRTTFDKLVKRLGEETITEIFIQMTAQTMERGIIKGNGISVDATIISAWFKEKKDKNGELKKSRDKDAGWGYDSYRDMWIYGYKIHILLDVGTGLPIALKVTRANYGENRELSPFVNLIHDRYTMINVKDFFADSAYDSNAGRLQIINLLRATPYIELNPRNCKGSSEEEKKGKRKKLCEKFYRKNFIHEYWIDPDSEEFDSKFRKRTLSEQMFSISKGSLNLDKLRHRGIVWATMHAVLVCMCMLAVTNTAHGVGRPDLARCIKCFNN
jgi:hypothetical protein